MADVKALADQLTATRTAIEGAVQPLTDAVNSLEARITAAGLPPAVEAQMLDDIAKLNAVATALQGVTADAGDGVDEGAPAGGGGVGGVEPI